MSTDLFKLTWFIIFVLVIIIAFVGNTIIVLAILRDKTMHTSTYFYIINVNIADIILLLSSLPERITDAFYRHIVFYLGMIPCYLLPFSQQVCMHGALGFLLILTIHRCYPAGIPRCLQRNSVRRQIRNHFQTSIIIWLLAIIINIPLFYITNYEKHVIHILINDTNETTDALYYSTCNTEATDVWIRIYLMLLLVTTYVITGIFLLIIYGQVIRILLTTKTYQKENKMQKNTTAKHYHFVPPNRIDKKVGSDMPTRSSPSSSTTNSLNQQQQKQNRSQTLYSSRILSIEKTKSSTNSHSKQHLQVIIMLFIVILLYVLLLLPYRLFNLLFIVHNQLFQYNFMNETLFQCLLNTVRLLVFLNCALQPVIYLIISSRLRQTVLKFLQLCCYKCYCHCQLSLSFKTDEHDKTSSNPPVQIYSYNKYPRMIQRIKYVRDERNFTNNNLPMNSSHPFLFSRLPLTSSPQANITPPILTHTNLLRK